MDRTLVLKFDTRTLTLVGALMVMVAVGLPWANLPSFVAGGLAQNGIAGGGLVTLGLAVLATFSLLLPWHPLERVSLPAALLALLVNLVALLAFFGIIQLASDLELDLRAQLGSVGSGLYLTFAGACLMLFGGLANTRPSLHSLLMVRERRWFEPVVWLALGAMLLSCCLCTWGTALVVRPYTLAAPGQARATPTFAPVPNTYLATPLVDVQLAPLGSPANARSASPLPTSTRGQSGSTSAATSTPAPSLAATAPAPLPSQTLPAIRPPTFTSTPTPPLPVSPLATPTAMPTATRTLTTTQTITPTTTATATLTATP